MQQKQTDNERDAYWQCYNALRAFGRSAEHARKALKINPQDKIACNDADCNCNGFLYSGSRFYVHELPNKIDGA